MDKEKRILVVDDDDNMREAICETIKRMGITVDTAVNGMDGFEKATNRLYDLIISDMRMPNIDGLAMFEMLKGSGIKTPVCFVTGYGTVTGAVDALKLGAYDYILKPFPPDVIEELIRRTFELSALSVFPLGKDVNEEGGVGLVYKSAYMAHLFALAKDVAKSESTVLITGESGTGKEVLARYIHDNSNHSSGQFVAVNCAAIPDNLLESELFGFEKGAFTGADKPKAGKFELANNGTLLLDEIGEIPINLQAKLLRVLQEREVERLGGVKPVKLTARILATTNRSLKVMVDEGTFREDLFYRLNVISMELPSLRQRVEDIADLARFFVKKYATINNKAEKQLSEGVLKTLKGYDFPGNVRELEHTIERAVVLSKGENIEASDLFLHGITVESFNMDKLSFNKTGSTTKVRSSDDVAVLNDDTVGKTIADVERELILKTLKDNDNNKTRAAEVLGITVRTLRNKLNEYKEQGIIIDEK